MRRALPVHVAFLLLAALGVAAADTAPSPAAPPGAELEAVLARFATAQAELRTLQGEFEERKEISLLKEPVVQTGTFYHTRPDLFLWDYRKPRPKKILLNSEVLLAYYPELNKAEEVNVRRWNKQIRRYLQVGADLESLREDYDISLGSAAENGMDGTDLLLLEPRERRLRSRLDEIRIWLDHETGQTRKVAYRQADGDRTVFTFRSMRVNGEIQPSVYHIDLPRDVKMGETFTAFSGR